MASREQNRRGRLIPATLLGTASWYVLSYTGPIVQGTEIAPLPAAAALCLTGACFVAAADLWWHLGDILDLVRATTPTGLKGTARFVRRLREIRHDLLKRDWGPFWGTHRRGEPIFADYASNALTLGPAGTGKGICVVQPMVMAIRASKTVVCFKGENTCVLANALRRRGEVVRVLNLGDLWTEIIGPSDEYNPLAVIADNFWRAGGLRDVSDDIHELCLQLYPEPEGQGGKDDNRYFRDGSRSFIGFAIQTCVLVHGYEATLGHVSQMLNDRRSLLQHALWASGRLEQRGEDTS